MDESEALVSRSSHAPSHRSHHQPMRNMQMACVAILVAVLLERLAYYGIVGNLVLFLNMSPLSWLSYNATMALFIFTGITYFAALVGGWIADAYLGKFKTLVLFFIIYIVGYALLPALAKDAENKENTAEMWCDFNSHRNRSHHNGSSARSIEGSAAHGIRSEGCSAMIFVALAIIGVANGVVRVNITPFGADQVKHEGPTMTRRFFNSFYWCINVGALLSLGLLSWAQQQYSFYYGYLTPAICLAVGFLVFVIGRCVYITRDPTGSILCSVIGVLCESCKKRTPASASCCCCCSKPPVDNHDGYLTSPTAYGTYDLSSESQSGCLDEAKISRGGSYHDYLVNDVRSIMKILGVFLAMIPYWLVYFQLETTFVVQGLHMRLDFGESDNTTTTKEFKIPIAWLSLFDVICIIFLLPLFDRAIYPALDRRGYTPPLRSRIITGMVFSGIAVVTAGCLEMYRLHVYLDQGLVHNQTIGNTTYNAADISIAWQIPQYVLIGIGELFASVGGLELAYSEAPRSMSGLIMGLFMFTQGLGSFLGIATIYPFLGIWFSSTQMGSINCRDHCHLDYYYFFLTGLQVLGILLFWLVTKALNVGFAKSPTRQSIVNGLSTNRRPSDEGNLSVRS